MTYECSDCLNHYYRFAMIFFELYHVEYDMVQFTLNNVIT